MKACTPIVALGLCLIFWGCGAHTETSDSGSSLSNPSSIDFSFDSGDDGLPLWELLQVTEDSLRRACTEESGIGIGHEILAPEETSGRPADDSRDGDVERREDGTDYCHEACVTLARRFKDQESLGDLLLILLSQYQTNIPLWLHNAAAECLAL